MTLTYVWSEFFFVYVVAALVQWLGFREVTACRRIVDDSFDGDCFAARENALPLAGVIADFASGICALARARSH